MIRERSPFVDVRHKKPSWNSPAEPSGPDFLVGLLDAGDGRLKRLAAKDILDRHARFRELHELTQRIEAIEERLEARG